MNVTADGEQAWEALCSDHYDLLVTDNQMPRLAGIKLIERMHEARMSLPEIVVSASFPTEVVRDLPALRIDAVLPKPFDIPELLSTMRVALSSGGHITAGHAPLDHTYASRSPSADSTN